MSAQPMFYTAPLLTEAPISSANTNRDGTGTIVTVWDGAACANGARVERVAVKAQGTTTAGLVRIYVRTSSAGTWRLLYEVAVSAITPSSTVATFGGATGGEFAPTDGLNLPKGAQLGAAPHNAESFNVLVLGGTY